MTRGEVARLLAFAATFDQRTVGEADVLAWYTLLAARPFEDAMEAVRRWYAENTTRVMPANVLAGIRTIGNERTAAQVQRVLALEAGKAVPPPPEYLAAREAFGDAFGQPPPGPVPDWRRVACPWCRARPGIRCTAVGGDGDPMSYVPAHPARYAAAGAPAPRVDAAALAARKAGGAP